MILFGFVSIFIMSFPSSGLLPLCAIAWELELVIDATKMATGYRKSLPRRAEDIGVWEDVMKGMAAVACISNAYQLVYLANFDYSLGYSLKGENRANVFWIICISATILRSVTQRFVPPLPSHVKVQLARRAFLTDKLVMNRPDNNFEDTSQVYEDNAKFLETYDTALAASSSPLATRRLSKNWSRLRDDFKTKQILKKFFPDKGVIKPDAALFQSRKRDVEKGGSRTPVSKEGVELVPRKSGHQRSATAPVRSV